MFLETTILLEIITLDQIPRRPTIRKIVVECSQTCLEDKCGIPHKSSFKYESTENNQLETLKLGKTYCYHPVDLVAPDGEHGPVDGPGVGVEADTDLQGNVWVKTRL